MQEPCQRRSESTLPAKQAIPEVKLAAASSRPAEFTGSSWNFFRGRDDVQFTYCLECGQIPGGRFPGSRGRVRASPCGPACPGLRYARSLRDACGSFPRLTQEGAGVPFVDDIFTVSTDDISPGPGYK
jgi:hypothetical protein